MSSAIRRRSLPQLSQDKTFMTDAGVLTIATFEEKIELGKQLTFLEFFDHTEKKAFFDRYYRTFAKFILSNNYGLMIECLGSWKASKFMGTEVLGLTAGKWEQLTKTYMDFVSGIRDELESDAKRKGPVPSSDCCGCHHGS